MKPPYNNIVGIDPELSDPSNGDYRPVPGSPAIGYGCQTFTDEGHDRPPQPPGRTLPAQGPVSRPAKPLKTGTIVVSGPITENTLWDAAKVEVVGDVTVENGVTLAIAPGVLVEFQDYFELAVQGRLLAVGTSIEKIVFTSDEPQMFTADGSRAGCWHGIRFHDTPETNGTSRLEHCILEYSKATPLSGAPFSQGKSAPSVPVFAKNQIYPYGGGAISVCGFSKLAVRSCIIRHNVALCGGAVFLYRNANPKITGNLIAGNHALENASALYCAYSYPLLSNNTIDGNVIHNNDNPYIESCAIFCFLAKPQITNNIIRDNDPEFLYMHSQLWQNKSYYTRYNNIEGYGSEHSNIDADPLFVEPGIGDLHLSYGSPCIDAGSNAAATANGGIDFEGDPRLTGGVVDIGCDEFHRHLYSTGEAAPGGCIDLRVIDTPGTTPVTVALGSGTHNPPQPTPYGDLHLLGPLLWQRNIGAIPPKGILRYPVAIPPSVPPGGPHPFQALLGPPAPGSQLSNLLMITID